MIRGRTKWAVAGSLCPPPRALLRRTPKLSELGEAARGNEET